MLLNNKRIVPVCIVFLALLLSAFSNAALVNATGSFSNPLFFQTEEDEEEAVYYCTADAEREHPGLLRLQRKYDLAYETLLSWYCDGGYGMGEINQVLSFAQSDDTLTADEIFAMILAEGDWDLVKAQLKGVDTDDLEDKEDEGEEESRDYYCDKDATREHPALEKIAEKAALDYAVVETWYCDGDYGVGEIKKVLRFADRAALSPEELFALYAEHGSWGDVMKALKEEGILTAPGKSGETHGDDDKDNEKDEDAGFCAADKDRKHPALSRLAASAGLEYATVHGWYCEDGYGVGTIKNALKYAASYDIAVDKLFALYDEYGSWGQVKKALKDS